jgi:hypothetical protein
MFYPSKNNDRLNRLPFSPEAITGTAMVNPHYPVELKAGARYIIDSGAFQERDMVNRLEPWTALDRQLRLEAQIEYGGHDGHAEAIVTYDMLDGVDEALTEQGRVKRRGDDDSASPAVLETIRSAKYYVTQRHRIRGAIAYACQGVSTAQYVACAEQLIPLMRPWVDWFAFGGLCITGLIRGKMLPVFEQTLYAVTPMLVAAGVLRAHMLGVCIPEAVRMMRALERTYPTIVFSTDSRAPETAGCIWGRVYKEGRQVDCYTKDQKWVDYHPNELAHRNVRDYATWMEGL